MSSHIVKKYIDSSTPVKGYYFFLTKQEGCDLDGNSALVHRGKVASDYRKAIWVYQKINVGNTYSVLLYNNQLFDTIGLAARTLKVSDMTINKFLDTYTDHKGFYYFSEKQEENGLILKLKEANDKSKGYWVYKKIKDQYSLLDNQPFKSKSSSSQGRTFLTMVLRDTPINGIRHYSTNPVPIELAFVKTYNADLEKIKIIKENANKAGVYRWTNKINGETYIGSSINLGNRLRDYYSIGYLEKELKKGKSIIYNALLKYGYSNFSLDIIEYSKPSEVIKREQYFLNLCNPIYNICLTAGSRIGHKASEETKAKMSASKAGNKYAAMIKWSEEAKAKIKGRKRAEGAGTASIPIEVFDLETKTSTTYASIKEAVRVLGVSRSGFMNCIDRASNKPYKNRYFVKKLDN